MPNHMKALIIDALKENKLNLSDAKITILGYAFLENPSPFMLTDDHSFEGVDVELQGRGTAVVDDALLLMLKDSAFSQCN